MTFRDVDMGIRQGVGTEERREPAEVGDAVRDLVMGADLGGGDEFATMALTVVDRQRMHFPALGQQVSQEDGGIHSAGVNDDGALHQRGSWTRTAPRASPLIADPQLGAQLVEVRDRHGLTNAHGSGLLAITVAQAGKVQPAVGDVES